MADDFVRKQIGSLVAQATSGSERAAKRLEAVCWPGGSADRVEPVAISWLAQWRPARAAAPVPECLCRSGHCPVCN